MITDIRIIAEKTITDIIINELKKASRDVPGPENACIAAAAIPPDTINTIKTRRKIKDRTRLSRTRPERPLFASLKKEEALNLYCIYKAEFLSTPNIPPRTYKNNKVLTIR